MHCCLLLLSTHAYDKHNKTLSVTLDKDHVHSFSLLIVFVNVFEKAKKKPNTGQDMVKDSWKEKL